MLTPFILFFSLTVATAVIAYWSDNLGKKLGKKRISWFGLRPRTTATLLTIGSSWGIMLATILVLLAVAEPLRSALFRFDLERSKNKDLVTANGKLDAQNQVLSNRQQALQQQNQTLAQKNQDASRQLLIARTNEGQAQASARRADAARQKASEAEKRAQRRADIAHRNEERARQDEQEANVQAAQARQSFRLTSLRLHQTQTRLGKAEANLKGATQRFSLAKTRLGRAQSQLAQVQRNLKTAQGNTLAAQRRTLAAFRQVADAFRQVADARRQVAATKAQVEDIKRDRDSLQADTKSLLAQYKQLDALTTALDQQFQLATRANVRITLGQTLAQRVVSTVTGSTQIEVRLRELLRDGKIEVARQIPDATLALSALIIRSEQQVEVLDPPRVLQGLVQYIGQQNGDVSIRLVASRNFSASEKEVTARFVVVNVAPALTEGEVLAENNVDGSLSDAKVFSRLLDLVDAGRDVAANTGLNPPVSADQPFYVAGTNERLFEALRQIRQINGPTHVKIVAATALTTVDPLEVRFEIEAIKS